MVYCTQCGTEVNTLFTIEMWKNYLFKTFAKKQDSVPACLKCAVKISIKYIDKKHYISLKHSSVKPMSDLII